MKITIPDEYLNHFPKETMWLKLKGADQHCATREYSAVFITRWHKGTLLLLNTEEYGRLKDNMGHSAQNTGLARFISAGIQTAILTKGEVEIPEHLTSWLDGNERTITKSEIGLLVR